MYIPVTDYKKHLLSGVFKAKDSLFKVEEFGDYEFKLVSSPERGEFTIHPMPYGFYLLGYGGESQYTIHWSSMQSGITDICVVSTQVDSFIRLFKAEVQSGEEIIAINDMLNKLYFGVE